MDRIPNVRHKIITGATTYDFGPAATAELEAGAIGIVGVAAQTAVGVVEFHYGAVATGRIVALAADAHFFFPFPIPLVSTDAAGVAQTFRATAAAGDDFVVFYVTKDNI